MIRPAAPFGADASTVAIGPGVGIVRVIGAVTGVAATGAG